MLKFQDDYTTLIFTFEALILLVYVMVDDLGRVAFTGVYTAFADFRS